jgi:hypothetical protein
MEDHCEVGNQFVGVKRSLHHRQTAPWRPLAAELRTRRACPRLVGIEHSPGLNVTTTAPSVHRPHDPTGRLDKTDRQQAEPAGPCRTNIVPMTWTACSRCPPWTTENLPAGRRRSCSRGSALSRRGGVPPPGAAASSAPDTPRTQGRSPPSAATAAAGPGPRPCGPWRGFSAMKSIEDQVDET